MGLDVIQIAIGGLDDNFSYIVYDDKHNALVVDPSGSIEKIFDVLSTESLTPAGVLITHTHFDHIDKLGVFRNTYAVPVYVHENGVVHIDDIAGDDICALANMRMITLGAYSIEVIHTPGHIADAVCFFISAENAIDSIPKLVSGDMVFVEGCGRTTEHGVRDLYESIQRIKTLPNDTQIYPGHDYGSVPHSTIAHEKKYNKYFRADTFEIFRKLRLS